jgi:hypothetical protein
MIKPLNIKQAEIKTTQSDIQTFKIDGNAVLVYNRATAAAKAAEADQKAARPDVVFAGLDNIVTTNTGKIGELSKSVVLMDETGATARVTMVEKYSAANADVVDAMFSKPDMQVKIGNKLSTADDFVQYELKASFDSSVFLNTNGNFDKERYDAFSEAIAKVAAKFNVSSPLSNKQIVQPKPDFHQRRWSLFSASQQKTIQEVLPFTVMVSPKDAGDENWVPPVEPVEPAPTSETNEAPKARKTRKLIKSLLAKVKNDPEAGRQ